MKLIGYEKVLHVALCEYVLFNIAALKFRKNCRLFLNVDGYLDLPALPWDRSSPDDLFEATLVGLDPSPSRLALPLRVFSAWENTVAR